MLKPTVVFNVFSYSGDEEKIIYCVKSLRRFWPSESIYVWNDGNSPMSESILRKLRKLNCQIKTTKYPRRGNLIGENCLKGMMGNYIESSKTAKYIAKIDPDILILKKIEFQGNGCFCKGNNGEPYGGLYYFDSRLIRLFRKYLENPEYRANLLKKQYFKDKKNFAVLEDYSFYHLVCYFFGSGVELKKENYWGTTDNNPIKNFGTRRQNKKDIPERMAKTLRNLN